MTTQTDPNTYFSHSLPQLLATKPNWLPRFRYVVQFHIDGAQGGDWVLDGKASPPTVKEGRAARADCEVACTAPTLGALQTAQLTPKQAFDLAQLKVKGLFNVAMKLGIFFARAEG